MYFYGTFGNKIGTIKEIVSNAHVIGRKEEYVEKNKQFSNGEQCFFRQNLIPLLYQRCTFQEIYTKEVSIDVKSLLTQPPVNIMPPNSDRLLTFAFNTTLPVEITNFDTGS